MSHLSSRSCLLVPLFLGLVLSCTRTSGVVPGKDATMEPRCVTGFDSKIPRFLARQGVPKTSTYFPPGEVRAQFERYPGPVCPEQALGIAVEALLASNAPESLAGVGAEFGPLECDARCFFDRHSSLLGIVADEQSRLAHRLLPSSPRGGKVRDHWVFFLTVTDLSQHGYWALVARDGSGVRVVAEN